MIGLGLRQHVVEFKPGIGVVTDGVIDATSVNGPWSWVVPAGVCEGTLGACGGGQGGQGGAYTGVGITAAGGGQGGAAGAAVSDLPWMAVPGTVIQVACGSAGLGAPPMGSNLSPTSGDYGGATTVSGVSTRLSLAGLPGGPPVLRLWGGASYAGNNGQTAVTSGNAAGGLTGAGLDAPNSQGIDITEDPYGLPYWFPYRGSVGRGGGAVTGAAGKTGGFWSLTYGRTLALHAGSEVLFAPGLLVSGVSIGGGGTGADSWFGKCGLGGSGSSGTNASGNGAGGGGGAGGFPGGNGSPGYVRFTYWGTN